jgi:SAM-dependent MidA family methyltransferase
MRAVGESLERGALIVIDYGFPQHEYYHPQRSNGTLMCHYRHRAHGDPFSSARAAGHHCARRFQRARRNRRGTVGLEVLGYSSQARFLVNCGITELLASLDASDVARYAPAASAANRLLSPGEMGELFKVLAAGRGPARALCGFADGDRTYAL